MNSFVSVSVELYTGRQTDTSTLGNERQQRSRPIIMNFRDYNENIEVSKNCNK